MARLAGLTSKQAGWTAKAVYAIVRRRLGMVPEPVTIVARHPTLLKGYVGFEMFLERAKRVDARTKNLVNMKVAALVGCPF